MYKMRSQWILLIAALVLIFAWSTDAKKKPWKTILRHRHPHHPRPSNGKPPKPEIERIPDRKIINLVEKHSDDIKNRILAKLNETLPPEENATFYETKFETVAYLMEPKIATGEEFYYIKINIKTPEKDKSEILWVHIKIGVIREKKGELKKGLGKLVGKPQPDQESADMVLSNSQTSLMAVNVVDDDKVPISKDL